MELLHLLLHFMLTLLRVLMIRLHGQRLLKVLQGGVEMIERVLRIGIGLGLRFALFVASLFGEEVGQLVLHALLALLRRLVLRIVSLGLPEIREGSLELLPRLLALPGVHLIGLIRLLLGFIGLRRKLLRKHLLDFLLRLRCGASLGARALAFC